MELMMKNTILMGTVSMLALALYDAANAQSSDEPYRRSRDYMAAKYNFLAAPVDDPTTMLDGNATLTEPMASEFDALGRQQFVSVGEPQIVDNCQGDVLRGSIVLSENSVGQADLPEKQVTIIKNSPVIMRCNQWGGE